MLSLLVALAGVVGIAAPAQAATHTVQGTVSGPSDLSIVTVYLSQELSTAHGRVFTMFTAQSVGVDPVTGAFQISNVADGDYYLLVTAGDDWVQYFDDSLTVAGADPVPYAIALRPGVVITGTIHDSANPLTTLPGVSVAALGTTDDYLEWLSWDIDAGDAPVTGSDGVFRIVVGLGDSYELTTNDLNGTHLPQSWNHILSIGCGCDHDPITVSPAGVASPSGPYDFDLIDISDALLVSVLAMQWDTTDYVGVDVILEKLVSGTWKLVAHGQTDSSGIIDLLAGGAGDYRLRYTDGGVAKVVTLAVEPACGCGAGGTTYVLADGGRQTLLPGLLVASSYDVDLTFAKTPAAPGGGPTTPHKPRTSTVTGFTLPVATATPTPTPTPASTPTPSASPSDSTTPTTEPSTPPVTPTSADLSWLLWLIVALLAIGIIVAIVVVIRRR